MTRTALLNSTEKGQLYYDKQDNRHSTDYP